MRKLPAFALALAAILASPATYAAPLVSPGTDGPAALPAGPATPFVQRGYRLLEAGDQLGAEKEFREAMRLEPTSPTPYIGMSELAAQRAITSGVANWSEQPDIESWLRKALEIDPNGVVTLRSWARFMALRDRFPDAEAALQKAVAGAPNDTGAWLHLSEIQLRGLRNGASAEASARKAIAINRSNVEAWMALATALVAQARADDAIAAFNQAAQVAPTEPQPLLALSRYHASRTRIDDAIAVLDRLIAALPKTGQAYLDRGDLLLLKNDAAGAMDAFRAAIKADPAATVGGQFRLGTMHQAMQQWSEAETAYRAAIEKRPDFSAAYNNLAFMLAERREKLDEALRLANRAVEIEPRAAPYLDTLGWVWRARGDLPAARTALERAIALQPRAANFHYHLGIIQAEQGRKEEAAASLRRVLELDPKFRQAADVEQRLKQLGAQP